MALVRTINEAKVKKEDILLFDREIRKAGTFAEFNEGEYKFIIRVDVGRKHEQEQSYKRTRWIRDFRRCNS